MDTKDPRERKVLERERKSKRKQNKSKSRSGSDQKKEPSIPKDGPTANIAAQTFTFRELATATKNFKPECFVR
ncbi:hypothetical protein NC652_022160 [Populus alba x Populus x berolinensis]|nr:hypothetical protein NC652_022160 [Populus alba x Populus x berolinensis]